MARQTAPHPSSSRAPSRVNKQSFITYVSPEALKQIRQLALDKGMSGQDLGAEALNLLFKKYKLDQIA
jgi:hypothetical protein